MKGLIIKDLINIKSDIKRLLIALIIFNVVGFQMKNPVYIISMTTIMCGILVITSIARDEMAKWDSYCLTMPINRSKVVISKYLLLLLCTIIPLVISYIFSYIFILPGSDMGSTEFIFSSISVFALMLGGLSLMIPVIFKFGVEKSRIIMFIIMAIPTILIVLFSKIGLKAPDENQIILLLKLSPLVSLALFLISMKVSVSIYNKKEF